MGKIRNASVQMSMQNSNKIDIYRTKMMQCNASYSKFISQQWIVTIRSCLLFSHAIIFLCYFLQYTFRMHARNVHWMWAYDTVRYRCYCKGWWKRHTRVRAQWERWTYRQAWACTYETILVSGSAAAAASTATAQLLCCCCSNRIEVLFECISNRQSFGF